ncbi:unnamed protein product, partial [Iphiclides podalirius]
MFTTPPSFSFSSPQSSRSTSPPCTRPGRRGETPRPNKMFTTPPSFSFCSPQSSRSTSPPYTCPGRRGETPRPNKIVYDPAVFLFLFPSIFALDVTAVHPPWPPGRDATT